MKFRYIYPQLFEANLTGKSRSGGTSNWEHYVVKNFTNDNIYTIDINGDVLDENEFKIGKVKKGDSVTITSPKLFTIGNKAYVRVEVIKNKLVGIVKLNMIQKPTTSSKDAIIPGGKNSKEFTPEKLGLVGIKFSSKTQMANTIFNGLKSIYGGKQYSPIRKYLYECIRSTTSINLTESFSKQFALKINEPVSADDISVLSKNFGEVLGALYILSTNKKTNYVEFPTDISQGLYDFLMVENSGLTNYYSVKSLGGSSTAMDNINFILKNFGKTNSILVKNKIEVDVIQSLINNKTEGITTIKNIENFFNKMLTDKVSKMITELNKISEYRLKTISQSELDKWFNSMIKTVDIKTFVLTMNRIYDTVLSDVGSTPKATSKVLEEIYLSGDGSLFKHGYLIYPMGSYIVNYLNNTGNYKTVLNVLLNYGSYIHQLTVNMYKTDLQIAISSFKTQNFKFSYNAGTKYPGNRPIGFIKS